MTKTDMIFPAFSSTFVDFAVQFCFRCKFSFKEEQRWSSLELDLTVARFFRPITILCYAWQPMKLLHLYRQMAFLRAKAGQGEAKGQLSHYVEIF